MRVSKRDRGKDRRIKRKKGERGASKQEREREKEREIEE